MVDRELLALIDALDPAELAVEAFRHLASDRNPLSGVGARIHGGRWNPPDSFSTLYLALERETTAREFYRLAARQGRTPTDFLPRRLYSYEVRLGAVLDLRPDETRASLGLTDIELAATDATRCQQIGEAAHYLGLEGVVAPSATGAGIVLAVYFDRLAAESRVTPLGDELWEALP